MQDIKDTYTLLYPKDSGFNSTKINFYSASPLLQDVFTQKDETHRLFVTDTNIEVLPDIKPFMQTFTKEIVEPTKNQKLSNITFIGKREKDIIIVLKAGEAYKTIESVLDIVAVALELGFTRKAVFTAIGGGVICDMTAFAASIFKRGVNVEFVPTTLLSMVDAAVGGKSGCDFAGYKNMIGSFWPATQLYVWPNFVKSLPQKEYISGLAEAIKTALLFSKELWNIFVYDAEKIKAKEEDVLYIIIRDCVKAKASIVQEDFREKGRRAYLNLGHTFGHALESCAGLGAITHGEAVAWGISRALELGVKKRLTDPTYEIEVKKVLSGYGYDTGAVPNIIKDKDCNAEHLLKAMKTDKKNLTSSKIRLILQKTYCAPLIKEVEDNEILSALGK